MKSWLAIAALAAGCGDAPKSMPDAAVVPPDALAASFTPGCETVSQDSPAPYATAADLGRSSRARSRAGIPTGGGS